MRRERPAPCELLRGRAAARHHACPQLRRGPDTSDPATPTAPWYRRPSVWLVAVLVVTAVAYAPALGNGFVMDDRHVALGVRDDGVANWRIRTLQPLWTYFSTGYWADSGRSDSLFRPLTTLSFALRHHAFGDAPLPAHLANIVLHLAATLQTYLLARRLTVSRAAAVVGAAVFGLHAVHTEVVANIVGRAELLGFTLGAFAVLLACPAAASTGARRVARLGGASVLLFLAFCSKESALAWLPLVAVVACAQLWLAKEAGERRLSRSEILEIARRTALVGVVPLVVFLALRQNMIASLPGPQEPVSYIVNPIAEAPPATRILTAVTVLGHALRLLVWPFGLRADYGAEVFEVISAPSLAFLVAFVALATPLALGVLRRRRAPALFVAVAALYGMSFITSNLAFPIGTIFGERLLYSPSIAVALAAAWSADRLRGRRGAWLVGVAACGWLVATGIYTPIRSRVWREENEFFLTEARLQPRSARMRVCASSVHFQRGDRKAAREEVRACLDLTPDYRLGWSNLAALAIEEGRWGDAAELAARAQRADLESGSGDRFGAHANLGIALINLGRAVEATRALTNALRESPGYYRGFTELYTLHRERGALDELDALFIAQGGAPSARPQWTLYRGILAHFRGDYASAAALIPDALRRVPRHERTPALISQARFSLGHSLLQVGRAEEAIDVLRALAIDPLAAAEPREAAEALVREQQSQPR